MKLSGGALVLWGQGPPLIFDILGVVPGGVGPPLIIQDPPPLGPNIKIIKGWVLIFVPGPTPLGPDVFWGGSWWWVLDL